MGGVVFGVLCVFVGGVGVGVGGINQCQESDVLRKALYAEIADVCLCTAGVEFIW